MLSQTVEVKEQSPLTKKTTVKLEIEMMIYCLGTVLYIETFHFHFYD